MRPAANIEKTNLFAYELLFRQSLSNVFSPNIWQSSYSQLIEGSIYLGLDP